MSSFANVDNQYKCVKRLRKEDILALREWLKSQPHLPSITELELILFLNSCNFSNEATKTCIDNYYTVRKHCPEFFAARNPCQADLKFLMNVITMFPLPKQTPEGYTVYYSGINDSDTDKYHLNNVVKLFDMMVSFDLKEKGAVPGHLIIVDLNNFTLGHMMKMSIVSIKKYLFFLQEALPVSLKGLHYVNAVPFMDKLLALFKPFMKKELLDMLQIHSGKNETLFNIVPKDCLPNELGGSVGTLRDLHNEFYNKLCKNEKFFAEEESAVVDENLRPGKPKNVGEIFGVEGTFKKLDID